MAVFDMYDQLRGGGGGPQPLTGGMPDALQQLQDQMSARYQRYAEMPDDTMTKAGIPLGQLRELLQAKESRNFGGYDALAWHPNYVGNARDRPTTPTGFPDWEGSRSTGMMSHGAGAYSFEPASWNEFAPQMGITDFSKPSQDAVFNAMVERYGVSPWRWNKPLMADIAQARQQYGRPQVRRAAF